MNPFFIETFNRIFKSSSPAFFIRVRKITGWLALANYLPVVLKRYFNIDLPEGTVLLCQDVAQYATGIFGGTFLATKTPTVGQTLEGAKVQVTNAEKMPFTAKAEAMEIEKADTPPPLMPEVTEKPTTPDV